MSRQRTAEGNSTRARVVEFVQQYSAQHKYPPTIREISAGVGLKSTSTVSYYIVQLTQLGIFSCEFGLSRSIVVADEEKAKDYIKRHLIRRDHHANG